VKKLPELLKHNAILSHWSSYPEGSIERAKSIGIELLARYTNLELTEQLWESELNIVAKEQAWKPLGLKSREEFIKAVTGRTETAVRKKITAAAKAREMAAAYPSLTQTEIAKQVGCTQQSVSKATTKTSETDKEVVCPEWIKSRTDQATFRKLSPADQERVRVGGRGSLRGIAIAAGIVKVASVLQQLRKVWAKATESDRRTFLEEVANG